VHTVICPARDEFKIVTDYCLARQIPVSQINFIENASELALPNLQLPALDMVLIDGRHGFPAPHIDWFYTAGKLRRGGYLLVDDTWLWSCQILRDFLAAQPEWRLIAEFQQRTAVFEKPGEGSEALEWIYQPFVAMNGRLRWINGEPRLTGAAAAPSSLRNALGLLRRRDLRTLSEKVMRRLRPR